MVVLFLVLLVSCSAQTVNNTNPKETSMTEKALENDSLYLEAVYFKKLRDYILKTGRTEEVNISSRLDKPMYITYHILDHATFSLIVDHTDRIYFNQNEKEHVGNLLLTEDKKVVLEGDEPKNRSLVYETYLAILKKHGLN